ncbi:HYC_CC_PP family protein [Brumimicrobium oceani]|uniref:Secreted protein n=1 Tax=Brumimicrobium oceani TaxID=2100725 RepID=A0A2U2XBL3_9FLAO|nr:hypothetical protein [Brumimicrobium oceani]PWH85186.1 hypothetical protein DIT68_11160 [Brumimicrobium oceani]
MLKRILSIFLMLVILVLNSGLTYITHYCSGEAVESTISLSHSDLSCGMTSMEMDSCENDEHKEVIGKKGCCENEYHSISAEIDYNKAQVSANTHIEFKFAVAFAYSFVSNYLFLQEEKPTFETYRPPFIDQDISVLHQVFII